MCSSDELNFVTFNETARVAWQGTLAAFNAKSFKESSRRSAASGCPCAAPIQLQRTATQLLKKA